MKVFLPQFPRKQCLLHSPVRSCRSSKRQLSAKRMLCEVCRLQRSQKSICYVSISSSVNSNQGSKKGPGTCTEIFLLGK